jgi:hypothetical protein
MLSARIAAKEIDVNISYQEGNGTRESACILPFWIVYRAAEARSRATEHWQASFPERNLERVLSPTRLSQLNECIPLVGPDAMKQAMLNIAYPGRDVCDHLATQHGEDWLREAAEAVIAMLR